MKMTQEELLNLRGLLNKFYFILENDVPSFKNELQPQIVKFTEKIERELKD